MQSWESLHINQRPDCVLNRAVYNATLCVAWACRCEPAPGTARDDARLLPWREQLEGALHAAFSLLKSPTEHESNPVIAGDFRHSGPLCVPAKHSVWSYTPWCTPMHAHAQQNILC